jgi:hypothetical protein
VEKASFIGAAGGKRLNPIIPAANRADPFLIKVLRNISLVLTRQIKGFPTKSLAINP